MSHQPMCLTQQALANSWPGWRRWCHGSRRSGRTRPTAAKSWRSGASSRALAGSSRSSSASQAPAVSRCNRAGGWWKGPSHTTYNAPLTSKPLSPMRGLAGLLKLLDVVSRLQAAQQGCACVPQEAGVLCPSSPPHPSSSPALPPAHEDTRVQSVGPVPTRQSAPAAAPARSARRTAVTSAGTAADRQPRGGQP